MKTSPIYLSFILLAFLLSSCNSNKKNAKKIHDTTEINTVADNSMNSLDWEGTYEGVLPCADCEGIKTVLSINYDNKYVLKEIYLGKDSTPFETKGTFKWDDSGQKITFSDPNRHAYFVGENTLTNLDQDGNKISGDLADHYILKKVNDQLDGKKWHLVSFKGEEIQVKEAKAEHAFVEFNPDFTIIGYTGCNNLQGGYRLDDTQKIKFSQLISTKKFCPEMETEHEFIKTLHVASYYAFVDHALVMYDKDHLKLATFKPAN